MTQEKRTRREILKAGSLCALGLAWPRALRSSGILSELTLYVGTYTSGKSEGIYIYRMNMDTGELRHFNTIKAVNPSFLAIDGKKRYLYAVNEVSEFAGARSGAVSAYAIDKTGNLKFLNQQPSMGGDPCHLILDGTSRFVLVANYTGGNVSVLPVKDDGSLGPATDVAQHKGSSVNRERQEGPHAHCIILHTDNRFALAADLGLDKVMIYEFDPKRGKLTPNKEPWVNVKPGAGPRHLTFHGKYAYVINELNSTLTAFACNAADGTLHEIQTVSTTATQGKTPRNFTIDPTARFLLVANQDSDTIVTFFIDPHTGRLKPTEQVTDVPTPVCLQLVSGW